MIRPRTLTWVAGFLYASVLCAGLTIGWAQGCGLARLSGLAAVLVLACGLEFAESARPATRWTAAAALVARAGLYSAATALDCGGNAKVLFVLIPLNAYFTLGPRIGFLLGGFGLLATTVAVTLRPDARRDPEALSDLLMLAIGIVFALAIAVVAAREEAARRRAEAFSAELSDAHTRLRDYADQAVSLATMAERTRLARDIHDTVGHHLVVTAIQLEKAVAYRPVHPDTADDALAEGRNSARLALEEVRRAVGTLRADDTVGFSLGTSLRALTNRLDDTGFRVRLDYLGDDHDLTESARLTVYLVTQEALTNARRHSGGTEVGVGVVLGPESAVIDIADNGTGFAPDAVEGQGLRGMRERLDAAGGGLEITSGPAGTRLHAVIDRPS
ncbi:histidine kinase [Nocardia sp. XZ_19_385]|uniref:sensor histidine kinase n=1 Tax=Nocardia sp. XZ_19_385 TaxID=2769488 RepID=UPI00188E8FEA|nr:histidine kinase [Nocardia sp. XZ_19_385]